MGLLLVTLGAALGTVKVLAERSIEAETASTILVEVAALSDLQARDGLEALRAEIARRREQRLGGTLYLLFDPAGELIESNVTGWSEPVPGTPLWLPLRVTPTGEREIRARAYAVGLDDGSQLIVGRTLDAQEAFARALNRSLLVAFTGALVIGLAGGILLARRTERRVEQMSDVIDAVRGGSLDARLPARTTGGDEFDRLSARINRLLEESEALIRGMRQVTDDVAHDLRTPLQRLHTRLEEALSHAEGQVYDEIEAALEDLDRLLRLFRTVLLITNTESGAPKQSFQEVDVAAIAQDAAELYEAVFEERGIGFEHAAPNPQHRARVRGNAALLAQAIANLLDNAAKYTPTGGSVRLTVGVGEPMVIEVRDTGPGIPGARRSEVLRRFTRLDAARETPGHGLGLALVNAVAKLHGGELELDDAAPGLAVRLTLPTLAAKAA